MTVFISYNHADKDFVDRLSLRLLNENVKVWRDGYKISAGDSLTARIHDAIEKASFLCIVISDSALASDWGKREIDAGLLRAKNAQNLTIIPLLLKDVKLPEALRDHLWIDFRSDVAGGMKHLLEVIRREQKLTASIAGTTKDEHYFIYYGTEGGWGDGRYDLVLDVVSFDREEDFCILTQVRFRGNDAATADKLRERGIESPKAYILGGCAREFEASPARLQLVADHPARAQFFLTSEDGKLRFDAGAEVKMLGSHRGETVVFNVGSLFSQICATSKIKLAGE